MRTAHRYQRLAFQRAWFISADDALLIQVQSDRFVHNWRRRGEPYPRFEPLYETFSTRLAQFEQVLARTNVPALAYNHVEVTYINWIEASCWRPRRLHTSRPRSPVMLRPMVMGS